MTVREQSLGSKVAKHFALEITDNSFSFSQPEEEIAAEAGRHGL